MQPRGDFLRIPLVVELQQAGDVRRGFVGIVEAVVGFGEALPEEGAGDLQQAEPFGVVSGDGHGAEVRGRKAEVGRRIFAIACREVGIRKFEVGVDNPPIWVYIIDG